MRRGYSLRRRLLTSMLLVFLLGVGATVAFYYVEVGAIGRDLQDRTLRSQARELLEALRVSDSGEAAFDLPRDWAEAYSRTDSTYFYTLYDASRREVASSPNLEKSLPFVGPPENELFGGLRFMGVGRHRLAAISARAPEGYVLMVARGNADEETLVWSLLEENLEYLGFVLIPSTLVAMGLIWLIGAWSLRPVARASREAAAVSPKNLVARITAGGLPSEIQVLVDAVNGALDRLSGAYEAERRLTADAAHQLRTPITVLSLRLQRAKLDGAIDWPAVEREIAQLERLIAQLLDLARKESAERMDQSQGTPVNLSRVAREAAAMVLPMAEKLGRPVEINAPEAVPVHGRVDDLRDMVRNLLDNALIHGEGAIRLMVWLEADGKGQHALLEIVDEGPGVSPALQGVVFERFRKGVAASPGAGLGLAIVRQVARSHRGEVAFLPGPGCRIRVSLPASGFRGCKAVDSSEAKRD